MNFNDIIPFITAGNSTFTIYSSKVNKRYTYKIKVDKKNENRFFVKVLFGPDNITDYRFLGWFYNDDFILLLSIKCCVDERDFRFTMLKYFLQFLSNKDKLPDTCSFYPSGRCGRCGRLLTTPESIERGLGPECAEYV